MAASRHGGHGCRRMTKPGGTMPPGEDGRSEALRAGRLRRVGATATEGRRSEALGAQSAPQGPSADRASRRSGRRRHDAAVAREGAEAWMPIRRFEAGCVVPLPRPKRRRASDSEFAVAAHDADRPRWPDDSTLGLLRGDHALRRFSTRRQALTFCGGKRGTSGPQYVKSAASPQLAHRSSRKR